jgi:hypothetical protein
MNDRSYTTSPQQDSLSERDAERDTLRDPAYDRSATGIATGDEALSPAMGMQDSSGGTAMTSTGAASLLSEDKATSYRERWSSIQGAFVDEPRDAVRQADGLVSDVIQELSQRFAQERQGLEGQWSGGSEASTEDLRMALRHYRDFFQRLLAA